MEMTLGQIAQAVGGQVVGDPAKKIADVAPLEMATPHTITYAISAKYKKQIATTQAGAIIVPADFNLAAKDLIQVTNPELAFARVIHLFHPTMRPEPGISSKAWISEDLKYGDQCHISPFVAVQAGVQLGHRVTLHPHVSIGKDVVIGDDVELFPNVSVADGCRIGNRVTIHAGTVIGSDGFGYVMDEGRYHKIKHIGIVQIDDDVEIGAANTIDRAKFGKTWIRRGVKTDNLVHIAHNVTIGEDSVIVAQVGIAGSATIGHHAILAGQAGVAQHTTIGNNVIIGPRAGITHSVPDGEVVSGAPGMPHRVWLRVMRLLPRLPEWSKILTNLEKRLTKIEDKQNE